VNTSTPLVSIICLTYNQQEFVRDAFDSFLSQKTNFPFEILVYDDASIDNTPELIQEYYQKYPNLFKITLYKENNFKKGLGFYGLRVGFSEARGKYIAYCEGDDYWCDEYKLQKQVDFLESNKQYEVCAHETIIRNDLDNREDGILFTHTNVNIFIDRTKKDIYKFKDTLTGNIFHISSMVFRNVPIRWPEWINTVTALDMILFMILAEKGDIYLMRDVMSVYRHNKFSITSTQNQFKNQIEFNNVSMELLDKMNDYWQGKYNKYISKIKARYLVSNMFCYLSKSFRNYRKALYTMNKAVVTNFYIAIKYIFIESYNKLLKHL
jgi:glycosyltransferase involved in cell wall biosynthesis